MIYCTLWGFGLANVVSSCILRDARPNVGHRGVILECYLYTCTNKVIKLVKYLKQWLLFLQYPKLELKLNIGENHIGLYVWRKDQFHVLGANLQEMNLMNANGNSNAQTYVKVIDIELCPAVPILYLRQREIVLKRNVK